MTIEETPQATQWVLDSLRAVLDDPEKEAIVDRVDAQVVRLEAQARVREESISKKVGDGIQRVQWTLTAVVSLALWLSTKSYAKDNTLVAIVALGLFCALFASLGCYVGAQRIESFPGLTEKSAELGVRLLGVTASKLEDKDGNRPKSLFGD